MGCKIFKIFKIGGIIFSLMLDNFKNSIGDVQNEFNLEGKILKELVYIVYNGGKYA